MINSMKNCPNCGALIDNYKCEYCGTSFINRSQIEKEIEELEKEIAQCKMQMLIQSQMNVVRSLRW